MATKLFGSRARTMKIGGALFGLALIAVFASRDARTAVPPSGTISSTSGPISWNFGPVVGGTAISVGLEATCPPALCDNYDLTVNLPAPAATFYQTMTARLTIELTWTSTAPTDLDIFAFNSAGAKYGPGSPDNTSTGAGLERLVITDPINGVWHVRSFASAVPVPTPSHAVATLVIEQRPATPPPPPPGSPELRNYPAPEDITPAPGSTDAGQHNAGEPSIGVNWQSGNVFIEAGNHTLRIAFDDSVTPASAFWEDKRSPFSRVSLDPILFTHSKFGRTFASQLDAACSLTSFTDDDGENWLPSQGCGIPAGPDHQTIGGGPYAYPLPPVTPTYPHAIYYCSQGIATALCARSDDGGQTFGPGAPLYTIAQCGGLHGHIKVAPDGTAYVPNPRCGGKAGLIVSTDNGASWTVKTVLQSTSGPAGGDPSVGIGANNTLYFGYVNADGHPKVVVSTDRGDNFLKYRDVGTAYGLQNAMFPEVIAGDDDRAAYAFLGTTTPGNPQDANFTGVWHLYVAYTYDAGDTWTTVDATPTDPVQRGCIWNGGGSNPCRNLLDFNDITVDANGRVLVGYADGCTGPCVTDPTRITHDALATIARQTGGRGLYSWMDGIDGTGFGAGQNQ